MSAAQSRVQHVGVTNRGTAVIRMTGDFETETTHSTATYKVDGAVSIHLSRIVGAMSATTKVARPAAVDCCIGAIKVPMRITLAPEEITAPTAPVPALGRVAVPMKIPVILALVAAFGTIGR
jgi:hypothetical protein